MNQPPAHSPDEMAIRKLIEAWARAVRAGDRSGILARHHPDMLMFDVPPPLAIRGLSAYNETWDLFFRESDYQGIFDIDELTVTAGTDTAFATALMHCGTFDAESPKHQLAFRLTVGLRKLAGEWMIVHEHHSIPAQGP